MSENIDNQVLVTLRGKSGVSNATKLLALTENEILNEIRKLDSLNQQIFDLCLLSGEKYAKMLLPSAPNTYNENTKLQIALAFFNALSVSSYTVLRSKLEKDLHER